MSALSWFYIGYLGTLYSIILAFSVVSYILTGKSLWAIARRRGIEKPWLAWVPVGNSWMMGCISDQYRYVSYGEVTNRRAQLMRLHIVSLASAVLVCVLALPMAFMSAGGASENVTLPLGMLMFVAYIVLIVATVVYLVNYYKACFDLFRSCDPDKSLMFLLVSIFVTYPLPFFLYVCRNKDLGMPPRQETASLPEAE